MINVTTANNQEMSLKDRPGFKLLLLFLLTFVALFIVFVLYNIFASMTEQKAAESAMPNEPEVVQIDPKIETDLAKVMSFDSDADTDPVRDPFADRGNISGNFARPAGTVAATLTGTGGSGNPGSGVTNAAPAAQKTGAGQTQPAGTGNTGGTTAGTTPAAPKPDTRSRYERWRQDARYRFAGEPDPQIFAVDDLIPIGVVSGGAQREEVIFYSQAAGRTLSFPRGTRFYDAWLQDITSEGVLFNFYDERNQPVRLKSWGRSMNLKLGRSS